MGLHELYVFVHDQQEFIQGDLLDYRIGRSPDIQVVLVLQDSPVRAAFELYSADTLHTTITGRPIDDPDDGNRRHALESAPIDDVERWVLSVFADALAVPVDTVREVDQLEALGCSSFKIVEITVTLSQRFPRLPSTPSKVQ